MKPVLIFPKPAILKRPKGKPNFRKMNTPSPAQQGLRLNTKINQLTNNLKTGILSGDPAGFSPERTLVLETINTIADFYRAASKIEGLELIQEFYEDEISPENDFYYLDKSGEKKTEKLTRYAYLTMTNQTALEKLIKYWQNYTKHKNYKFPRGLAPLKNLFKQLHNVRYWETEDRLRETGLVEDWRLRAQENPESVPMEIELWYHNDPSQRRDREERVLRQLQKINGVIEQVCTIEQIQYHCILARVPLHSVRTFIDNSDTDIDLLRCDEVMYFRPSTHCMTPLFTEDDNYNNTETEVEFDDKQQDVNDLPVVALLDGLPLENHEWIKDHIWIDDPDGWADEYTPADQIHGTSMASLIIRGDMHNSDAVIPQKIYCRPILTPGSEDISGKKRERIPEGVLPIDIVHRAVRRLFESENDTDPVAPSVKVINLSIADSYRLFDHNMSPWAKLIDYLSHHYQVLFIISAGNYTQDIDLGISNLEFNQLAEPEKEKLILEKIAGDTYSRRLMSPSESINALTVAAIHHDGQDNDEFYNQINPYKNRHMPSTINPISWGKRRSVKPEILMPGGRATYRLRNFLDNDPGILEILTYESPPGQRVASPGQKGSVTSSSNTFGTSNAAALASRRLCFLKETIQDLYISEHGEALSQGYETMLMKALICHGASQSKNIQHIEDALKTSKNTTRFKSIATKYLGFGNVDEERIHGCLDNQATILQCGTIQQDETHSYRFKLPDSLNAKAIDRRLIITLAWLSPINPSNYIYRNAYLWFEPVTGDKPDNDLALRQRECDWQMVRKGTVQHEVLSGDRASAYATGKNMEIKIFCKGQAGAKNISVKYGLVVTLDTTDVNLPIYDEVKSGINILFKSQIETKQSISN